jgi:outer membrane protein assembly factor BamB
MHLFIGCVALMQAAMFRGDLAHTAGRIIASPAIVGQNAYVGSTDGKLYAVDLGHGSLRWKFTTQARITSSPAVADHVMYVGGGDGDLYALY